MNGELSRNAHRDTQCLDEIAAAVGRVTEKMGLVAQRAGEDIGRGLAALAARMVRDDTPTP